MPPSVVTTHWFGDEANQCVSVLDAECMGMGLQGWQPRGVGRRGGEPHGRSPYREPIAPSSLVFSSTVTCSRVMSSRARDRLQPGIPR